MGIDFGRLAASLAIGGLVGWAVRALYPDADPKIAVLGGVGAAIAGYLTLRSQARRDATPQVPRQGERKFDKLFRRRR